MVWDFDGISRGIGYSWDLLWDGIFLGYPIVIHDDYNVALKYGFQYGFQHGSAVVQQYGSQ